MADSFESTDPAEQPRWTPEEQKAADILSNMLGAMNNAFPLMAEQIEGFTMNSISGCLFTRFGETMSVQVKVFNSDKILKSEFNYRIDDNEIPYLDKMDARLEVGAIPIEPNDIEDLLHAQTALTDELADKE